MKKYIKPSNTVICVSPTEMMAMSSVYKNDLEDADPNKPTLGRKQEPFNVWDESW